MVLKIFTILPCLQQDKGTQKVEENVSRFCVPFLFQITLYEFENL